MGSASLWRLAERGVPAIGFEQFEPGHDRGSSHGESRIIRTAYFEDPRYVPLVRRAFELWRDLERRSGEQILTMTGALSIGPSESELIAGTLASVRAHDLAHEVLTPDGICARFPQHRPREGDTGIFEADAGVLRPELAVRTMAAEAARLGAAVHTGTAIRRVEPDGEGVRIETGEGIIQADRAIVSVGPWLPDFLPRLHLPLQVTRQVLVWYPVQGLALFAPSRFPVFLRDLNGHVFYGFPTMDGRTAKMAIHHEGQQASAASVDRTVRPDDTAPLTDLLASGMHGLDLIPDRALVCLYTNTPDQHFVVDHLPEAPQIIILGGFSGHGFKFAPAIGEAATDLAALGKTTLGIEHFRLGRFQG
jgi:sarcosine oxidase